MITVREQLAHLDNGRLVNLLRTRQRPAAGRGREHDARHLPEMRRTDRTVSRSGGRRSAYGGAPVLASVPVPPAPDPPELARSLPLSEPDSPAAQALLALADAVMERIEGGLPGVPAVEDCEDCP